MGEGASVVDEVGEAASEGLGGGAPWPLQTNADQQIASWLIVLLMAALMGRSWYAQHFKVSPSSFTAVPAWKPSGVVSLM